MVHSWDRKPKARPTFLKIVEMLLDHIDKKPFLYLSFYNRWKNEQNSEKSIEENADEALVPLKQLTTTLVSNDEYSDIDSNGQICEEDMNVQFFPLSRPVANGINQQIETDVADVDVTSDQIKHDHTKDEYLFYGPTNINNENFCLMNNNLSTSLANSESSSSSNVDIEPANKESIISFVEYDSKKISQPNESNINNRNLINGHLINTSMV